VFGTNFFIVMACSFVLPCLAYPVLIYFLKKMRLGTKGHVDHIIDPCLKEKKDKTPSFGGTVFVFAPLVAISIVFPDFMYDLSPFVVLISLLAFVGFLDDTYKILPPKKGISAKAKSLGQLVAAIAFLLLYFSSEGATFYQEHSFVFIILWSIFLLFVIIGSSNAVNLTDGMDGLAGLLSIITLIFLGLVAYLQQQDMWLMVALSFICSMIPFCIFNTKPAKIFMGDVGSLPLGGVIAGIAIYLNQPWILLFFGSMFVVETLSVMMQVFYFKKTKKRIFACAPLHHHYQYKGWTENQVVLSFCGVQILTSILGFSIYLIVVVCCGL
jgi:phospho-N-acetylmuramoyl-pentapeptide-transferase